MATAELDAGLRKVLELIRMIGARFEESFIKGDDIDTFMQISKSSDLAYVVEFRSLEAREGTGFEERPFRFVMSYREVGDEEPIHEVIARTSPDGLRDALQVLKTSSNPGGIAAFGDQVIDEIQGLNLDG